MASKFISQVAVVAGALTAVLLLAPTAAATGQPGDGPLIHTTCSYEQLYAALRVEAPDLAAELDQRPAAQDKLRGLAVMSVEQREQQLNSVLDRNPGWREKLNEKWNTPEGQDKAAVAGRIAGSCHNY